MEFHYVKLEIYVPESHFNKLCEVLRYTDAGHVGKYDSCLSYSRCMGMWRPLEGTNPFIGETGKISTEPEIKIEVLCTREETKRTIAEIKRVHPYEEPVINAIPVLGTGLDR